MDPIRLAAALYIPPSVSELLRRGVLAPDFDPGQKYSCISETITVDNCECRNLIVSNSHQETQGRKYNHYACTLYILIHLSSPTPQTTSTPFFPMSSKGRRTHARVKIETRDNFDARSRLVLAPNEESRTRTGKNFDT